MVDEYKAKWENAVEEIKWLTEQNQRLKGNMKENPTLRDQFAMAALPAVIEKYKVTMPEAVGQAYNIADIMMEARDRK